MPSVRGRSCWKVSRGGLGELQGFPLFGVLGVFLGVFPFYVAIRKLFGTGNTCRLGKDVGLPMDLLASLSKFCPMLTIWRPTLPTGSVELL